MKRIFWFIFIGTLITFFLGSTLIFAAEPDFSKVPTAPKPEKLTVVLFEPVEQKAAIEVSKLFEEKFGIKVEVNAIPWSNLHEKSLPISLPKLEPMTLSLSPAYGHSSLFMLIILNHSTNFGITQIYPNSISKTTLPAL